MVKKGYIILFLLFIVTMVYCVGCTGTQNTISNETRTTVQVNTQSTVQATTQAATQATTQATTQANIPSTIYISSISSSAHTIHYSLTKDFEISKDALAFDNNCKYYNNLNQEISFAEFATIIYSSNKQNNTVKCDIKTMSSNDNNKLILEAHIAE